MSEYTKELQGYVDEIKGITNDLRGLPEEYKSLKARAEEVEKSMGELAQSVQTLMDERKSMAGGITADVISAEDIKSFNNYVKKGIAMEANGPSGGYLVVPQMVNRIIELQTDMDEFRPYANAVTIGSNLAQVPFEKGEPDTQWVGEIEQRADTDNVELGLANIEINTVQCTVPISRALLADGAVVNFEQYVMDKLAKAITKAENAAFVNGNGVKKPEGLFACADIPKTSATASAAAITADEVIGVWEKTTSATDRNGAYYMNKKTMASIRKLKASGSGEYLWQSPIAQGAPPTFNGFPVRILTSAPDIAASATPIAFGDLKNAYTIVDRNDMFLLRDDASKKRQGQIELTIEKRVGGAVVQPKSMALLLMHS